MIELRKRAVSTAADNDGPVTPTSLRRRQKARRAGTVSVFTLVSLIGLLLLANPLRAQADDNTLLILDASGSMWGRVEGRSKIETARDVIVDLLAGNPLQRKLGLMSYGHRRKGDCGDIELLVPSALNTTDAIQRALMSIQPRGKTPLSASVVEAARELRSEHSKATVILVSDGRETCDYDPCQVARELEASGVDFTAHVIGFNVTDPVDLSQLQCIADNTGGRFMSAGNGSELSLALQTVSDVFDQTTARDVQAGDRAASENLTDNSTGNSTGNSNGNATAGNVQSAEAKTHGNVSGAASSAAIDGNAANTGHSARSNGQSSNGQSSTGQSNSDQSYNAESGIAQGNGTPSADLEIGAAQNSGEVGEIDVDIRVRQPDDFRAGQKGNEQPESAVAGRIAGSGDADEQPGAAGSAGAQGNFGEFRQNGSASNSSADTEGVGLAPQADGGVITEVPASSITTEEFVATVTVPPTLYTLQVFTARWKGPGLPEDLIAIALPDSPADVWLQALPVGSGKKQKLKAPEQPGDYEVRYISANMQILASAAISVRKAEATLIAPQEVRSGRLVRIRWKGGTRDPKDSIVITRKGAPLSSAINRRVIRAETSVMLLMPSRGGDYELRYLQAGGNLIARKSIVVK